MNDMPLEAVTRGPSERRTKARGHRINRRVRVSAPVAAQALNQANGLRLQPA